MLENFCLLLYLATLSARHTLGLLYPLLKFTCLDRELTRTNIYFVNLNYPLEFLPEFSV